MSNKSDPAPKQVGPQESSSDIYPRPDREEGGWEIIDRHGRFQPGGSIQEGYEFKPEDGKGSLPSIGQPPTTIVLMRGTIEDYKSATLTYRRPHGSTGPYKAGGFPLLDLPELETPITRAR